jgi:hypothetical protein
MENLQKHCDVSNRMSLDETGSATNMHRRYGRVLSGARSRFHSYRAMVDDDLWLACTDRSDRLGIWIWRQMESS